MRTDPDENAPDSSRRSFPGTDAPALRGPRRLAINGVCCPRCGSDALYRYGRTGRGDARCLCKVCGRQFSLRPAGRLAASARPACPACGRPMHVYMRGPGIVRFRCSGYPVCRGFAVKREPPDGPR